jgi:ABC-2 type transport system permease protein
VTSVRTIAQPGSAARALTALIAVEARLALRRGENLVATMLLPAAVLLFLALVPLGAASAGGLDGIVPRVVATAAVATGLVSLGIATAFERSDGAQRRLMLAPVSPWAVVVAKAAVVALTVGAQVVLLTATAVLLGWRPRPDQLVAALPSLVLGTAVHAAAGLAVAFRFRAEATLALVNTLFLAALLAGGLIVPADALPQPFGAFASATPPGLLAAALRDALGPGPSGWPLGGLVVWTIVLGGLAIFAARVAPEG